MVHIKESNYHAIREFVVFNNKSRIQGTKLKALYFLIQKKGEAIKTGDENLNGLKCLEFDKGEFIALIHRPVKKDQFFPCSLKQIHLQQL